MKNKTKTKTNLKRTLLFFIPLCLIAGMFAVPAFAAVTIDSPTGVFSVPTIVKDAASYLEDGYIVIQFDAASFCEVVNSLTGEFRIFDTDDLEVAEFVVDNGSQGISSSTYFNFYVSPSGSDYVSLRGYSNGWGNSVTVWPSFPAVYLFLSDGAFDLLQSELNDANGLTFWSAVDYVVYRYDADASIYDPSAGGGDDGNDGGEGDTSGIFAVWAQITDWIVQGLASVSTAFYYQGQLTLLGYLCIIPLAVGLVFLLIGIIQKFLRLRG